MSAGRGGGAAPAPAGILADGVTRWFSDHVPGVQEPLAFDRIAGGQSNLTYTVADQAGGRWVLRRPPLSGVLPSAHDMAREHRIIAALAATEVPVPRAFGLCEDSSVTGAPFYVMEHVDGVVPRDEATVLASFGLAERAAASTALVDALLALHRVDPEAVGLGRLGRGHGYVERQLARWRRQWEQSKTRELPAVEEVHRRLTARVPAQERVAIVHGDYRLDNLILSPAGAVRAVIDWELSTLGDPRADLGLLLVYWAEAGDEVLPLGTAPTRLPGFPGRAEVTAAYASGAGHRTDDLDFFVALGYWKLAVILEGVYARYAGGAYGQGDRSWREFPGVVSSLADLALAATARAGR
jgi:aminoglycoside phosphotransferase (APT) family kinase protein